MNKRFRVATAAVLCVLAVGQDVAAADKFQKLSGLQIRAKLAGMEITDEAHWADVFAARAPANGMCRRMSCASIAARTTAAATRCGFLGRRSSSEGKVQVCRWRECFKSRVFVDDRGPGGKIK
jgi:hypothetical protein